MGLTDEAYRAELKRWYNGYRFSPDKPVTVYNPVSTGLTFAYPRDEFHGTWTATGRPVWAIGLAFDSKTRQLVDAKEERLA